jgi:sugar phosphate isomerase/epimerase
VSDRPGAGADRALGISSYAFRYAIGFPGFAPGRPMDASAFLREAGRLGLRHAQLCENLAFAHAPRAALERLRDEATDLGLALEVGMKSLSAASLDRHLDIAHVLRSRFLRVVLGAGGDFPDPDPDALARRAVAALRAALPRIRDLDLGVGIENHFDLRTAQLVRVVDAVDDGRVGMVFDTTNALGFGERPAETLAAIGARVVSVHLKDYSIRKVEAGYLVSGEVLGEGLLDLKTILGEVERLNPRATVLLEMTIRRREGASPDEAAAWERDAIERSAAVLRGALARVPAGAGR